MSKLDSLIDLVDMDLLLKAKDNSEEGRIKVTLSRVVGPILGGEATITVVFDPQKIPSSPNKFFADKGNYE